MTALSLTKFDSPNRGFRIGVDASIWFAHSQYGKGGDNPELRMLFFRCAHLLDQGFLPLFMFDGPLRPDVKRGKSVNKSDHKLRKGMEAILEAFGFEYRTAPGEAEAELAFLNRIGILDGVLSDDVDNFLFGAHTVIRNRSSTHAGAKSAVEKAQVIIYNFPHPSLPDIEREDLIFIALCSGGDYDAGLDNCGIRISYGLVRAGFGKSLCKAAKKCPSELPVFLRQWKADLAAELKTNKSGLLPHKSPRLAGNIPESFPNIEVLLSYLVPVTTEGSSNRYAGLPLNHGGNNGWLLKEPSLAKLAGTCESYFRWGSRECIAQRFRNLVFRGITLRILRRAICVGTLTDDPNVILLEIIRSYFCSGGYDFRSNNVSSVSFIKGISKIRTHDSTSKTLEYRVCIDPSVLAQLTVCGAEGIQCRDHQKDCKELEIECTEGGGGKKSKGPAPHLPLKLWLPAVLVRSAIPRVVEEYEEVIRQKKNRHGKGADPSFPNHPNLAAVTDTTGSAHENSTIVSRGAQQRNQRVSISGPGGLLSQIDDISTSEKRNQNRPFVPFEVSPPERVLLQPFPLSIYDDYGDSDGHPDPPPLTPSPRKKTRKVSEVESLDLSASDPESTPWKDREHGLKKSPRKSKEHGYPKGLDNRDENGQNTIHHHSQAAWVTSPDTVRLRSVPETFVVKTIPPSQKSNRVDASSKTPVFVITDSEDEGDALAPSPRSVGLRVSPKRRRNGNRGATANDNEDISLLRIQGTVNQAAFGRPKVVGGTTEQEIIELD